MDSNRREIAMKPYIPVRVGGPERTELSLSHKSGLALSMGQVYV